MQNYRYKPVFFLSLLLSSMTAFVNPVLAQGDGGIETSYFARLTGITNTANSVALSAGNYGELTYAAQGEQTRKIQNIIMFNVIEETPRFIAENFTATVQVRIDYGTSSVNYSQYTHTFTVDYNKNEGAKYNAKNYFSFENAEFVRITVIQVNAPIIGSLNTKEVLLLQNELRTTRYFELANNVTPLTFTGPASVTNPVDAVPVAWSWPANAGLNHTQLEWTWLENEVAANYYIPNTTTVDVNKLFKDNATRMDLPFGQNAYNIPLFYAGIGQLYYRIRAVNIKGSGNRSDGPWSTVRTCAYGGHEPSLNWQGRTLFTGAGLSKSTIEYFDGSLRPRQTVIKDNVSNTTMSAETIYDEQGRPAIQILPSPSISTIVAYTKNLNLFNGQVANQDHLGFFDLEPIATPTSATPPLSTSSGTSRYFSPSNPDAAVGSNAALPDAEGYPYSVTRYTPDASGRVMARSGMGAAMKMGSGRETKHYYGTPSQEELDALFGTEVGHYTHYGKNMTKDANGQMSVAYVDMRGQIIATALAGDAPAGLAALNINNPSYYPGQAGSTITRNLLDVNTNVVKNNSIESVTSILAPATTLYNFTYQLNPDVLQLTSCLGPAICYDCMYNLEISITDESGDMPPIVKKFNNINLNADDNCATPNTPFSNDTTGAISNLIQFGITLPPGAYSVRKTLTISESSVQKYKELYLTKGLCKTEQQLIDSVYNVMLQSSDCDDLVVMNCQSCLAELGTYTVFRTNYLNSIGNPNPVSSALEQEIQTAYNAGVQDCNRICNNTSQLLSSKRQLMLMDMVPDDGQYARRNPVSPGSMYNKYDIFSTTTPGTQPFYKKPWNSNKQLDFYYDPFNVKDETIHPAGAADQYALLNGTTPLQFSTQFNHSWANALLPHHPEYDRLVYAETNLAASYNWIKTFSGTTTYAQATGTPTPNYVITSGNTTATPYNDPFYTVAGTTYRDEMAGWVTTNYQNGWSMWQIARGDVKCKNIVDPLARNNCYNNYNIKVPPFNDVTTAADLDQMWKVFRNLYAAARDNQVNNLLSATVPLADASTLISQGYKLHFGTNSQTAQQYGWTWYPSTPGANPPGIPSNVSPDSVTQHYTSRCNSYIDRWKQWLLQCPAVATMAPALQTQFLNEVTAAMATVCIKGSDAANPHGSSTVAPSTPFNGSPRSFEEVIDIAFANPIYNIQRNYQCNPYMIEFPKPYGKGPKMATEYTASIDTCNCDRLVQLKSEAQAAGYSPSQLSSLNQYFNMKYGDTMTTVLYNALQHCNELGYQVTCHTIYDTLIYPCNEPSPCLFTRTGRPADNIKRPSTDSFEVRNGRLIRKQLGDKDQPSLRPPLCPPGYHWDFFEMACVPDEAPTWCTVICSYLMCDTVNNLYYPLNTPQPMPEFLKCGFNGGQRCLTCADISALTAEFKTEFAAPYNGGPVVATGNLSDDDIAKNILYARFINYRTGFQFGWIDYIQAAANATPACNLASYSSNGGAMQTVICRDVRPLNDTTGIFQADPPCQRVYTMAVELAQNIYQQRVETLLANFEAEYRKKCMAAKDIEQFSATYANKEYHYTLYYRDMSGSLVKTVPPAGVRPDFTPAFTNSVKTARLNGTTITRPHVLTTNYRYNSINCVIAQKSPDADTTKYWYDRLGRLVVSQNAQQALDGKYTYTLIDPLARITETGQKTQAVVMTQTISQDPVLLNDWIVNTGGLRDNIEFVVYDNPYGPGLQPLLTQQNLRNRVSYSGTKNQATDVMHYTAIFYSYDIHGNVDTMLQDYKGISEMDGTNNRFKLLTYQYELINNKVRQVSYQPGHPDAFYHRFSYDTDSRIVTAETSRDKVIWERDAQYSYYNYGPLARLELGHLRVQGIDYAHTLQGWLKGVNSTVVGDGTYDLSKDGLIGGPNSVVARDILGFALHYYDNGGTEMDYKPLSMTNVFARPNNAAFKSLYDGNIGAVSMNNAGLLKGVPATTNSLPLYYNYGHDQLGRIVSMDAYRGLTASNQWVPVSMTDYAEAITYNPDGNIVSFNRKGAPHITNPLEMDNLTYNYYPNSNRLRQVPDVVPSGNYTEDIDNQSTMNNYTYDAIGNMKTDVAEGITAINWNMYGKITSLVKNGNTISYTYDASGNRISKTANGKTTIYVRNAKGDVMSVYEKPTAGAIVQSEVHLFGKNRLGMATQLTVPKQTATLTTGYGTATIGTFTRNEKLFELSNQVKNVLATIGDKKIPVSSGGSDVDYYVADVASAVDYYPFGMQMPGRKFTGTNAYRYGFNSHENDNDIKGEGNSIDFGSRIYDSRLGRFLSVDKLITRTPFYSPYIFAGDKPVVAIDANGDLEVIIHRWEKVYNPVTKESYMIDKGKITIQVPTVEDLKGIYRTPAEVNVVILMEQKEIRTGPNSLRYEYTPSLYSIQDVKNTGLDQMEQLKVDDKANYYGLKFFKGMTSLVGLWQLGAAMTGEDGETGETLSTQSRWTNFASGLLSLAGPLSGKISKWLLGSLIDMTAEEGIPVVLKALGITDKHKVFVLTYYLLRLKIKQSSYQENELKKVLELSAQSGVKASETFISLMKEKFGIDANMPVDVDQALVKAIEDFYKNLITDKDKKVLDAYKKKHN